MQQSRKCRCGKLLCPPDSPPSHFWHTAEGVFELCAVCSRTRAAEYGEVQLPDVRFDFSLVPHGYQLDVYFDQNRGRRGKHLLTLIGTSCRDFSGNHRITALRNSLAGALLAQVDKWHRDPTRGTAKRDQKK